MRQPPTGNTSAKNCESPEVTGEKILLAGSAQANDDTPPARSARNARRP
jgi:hypothetical protein